MVFNFEKLLSAVADITSIDNIILNALQIFEKNTIILFSNNKMFNDVLLSTIIFIKIMKYFHNTQFYLYFLNHRKIELFENYYIFSLNHHYLYFLTI